MKAMKKIGAILCSLAMILSLAALSGCTSGNDNASQPPDPAAPDSTEQQASITDGYYTTQINGMLCFYRFNEDNTYYGYFFDGGVTDAGTYELANKSMDYYETYKEDETPDENSKKTASQVIALTSYAGGEVQEIPLDGDRLCDFTAGGMKHHAFMDHEPDFAYNAEEMEPAIVVQTLYANNDSGMTLTLYHNRTFVDYTGDARVGGTWAPADGGYTLTTEGGDAYTLTMGDPESTYVKGGETVTLTAKVTSGAVAATFEPDGEVAIFGVPGMDDGANSAVKLAVYDNDTMELIADIFGNEVVVDKGTYTVDTTGPIPAYTFAFESAGELAAQPDYATATQSSIVLNLSYAVTDAACSVSVGGNAMDLALSLETVLSCTYTMG